MENPSVVEKEVGYTQEPTPSKCVGTPNTPGWKVELSMTQCQASFNTLFTRHVRLTRTNQADYATLVWLATPHHFG